MGLFFFAKPRYATKAMAAGISTQQAMGIMTTKNPITPHYLRYESGDLPSHPPRVKSMAYSQSPHQAIPDTSPVTPRVPPLILFLMGQIANSILITRFTDCNSNRPHLLLVARLLSCPRSNVARHRTYKGCPQVGRQRWRPRCCPHHEP